MYLRDGEPFDIEAINVIGENQYPVGWFFDPDQRDAFDVIEVDDPVAPVVAANKKVVQNGWEFVANEWVPKWTITNKTQAELDEQSAALVEAKTAKNLDINSWRAKANSTSFTHVGKTIACDALSRSDIDAVANSVALSGAFPQGFPNAWKAVDNTYIPLPDINAFKAMHASMTLQGTINFGHSQQLKAALVSATTLSEVAAIHWE